MSEMTPEKLKVVAEGMGWTHVLINEDGDVYGYPKSSLHLIVYEPDVTNDSQCMEIMEKLKLNVLHHHACGDYNDVRIVLPSGDFVEGKEIKEAVCNAAYDYFK